MNLRGAFRHLCYGQRPRFVTRLYNDTHFASRHKCDCKHKSRIAGNDRDFGAEPLSRCGIGTSKDQVTLRGPRPLRYSFS
jgi:hypothetical protein